MSEQGVIVKVSGPLIVAEGIPNAKMYDVVHVGHEKLIGEIIELVGEQASIQVYEETAGLKPGDPVETTGAPLSVELGPGLIGSIYDGVQRPLEALEAQWGAFIRRGAELPALNRERRWRFVPTVNVGQRVGPGDVLGTVRETSLVEQKILVPPGLSGTIVDLREGEFTVEEPIGAIQTSQGERTLTLMQRWPVRRARPFGEKLPPEEPLITGQRVIDAFFPIAKGGTACVPGPFGSGKCVSGDTPVLLSSGERVPIRTLFETLPGEREEGLGETILHLREPLKVLTWDGKRLTVGEAIGIYRGRSDHMVRIETRTSRVVRVTPSHRLFRVWNAHVIETPAVQLSPGDFLLTPRCLPLAQDGYRPPPEPPSLRAVDPDLLADVCRLIADQARRLGSKKALAARLRISYDVLINYFLGRAWPPVAFLDRLYALAKRPRPRPTRVKAERDSQAIRLPAVFDEKLAEFLGYQMSEGTIRGKSSVCFFNNDPALLERYRRLLWELFGLEGHVIQERTVGCVRVHSRALVTLLETLGLPQRRKSRTLRLPDILLISPPSVLKAFLRAYIAGDGHLGPQGIEIVTASEEMASGLVYAFAALGILARVRTRRVKDRTYYRVFISPKEAARLLPEYEAERYWTSFDTVPVTPSTLRRVKDAVGYARLLNAGVEIFNYIGGERLGREKFMAIAQLTSEEDDQAPLQEFAGLLKDFYCDEIVSVEVENGPFDVYDLIVPGTHNFVGGQYPMLLHNTVIQHQLAKWADADVIVFVGCGERGNEMTDVLMEFPELEDPRTGEPLMHRTVLIANTSNMPVAAREASIYTGITIAEYFRDMGYSVALMADSTSRWAEAMREISGRLEEMPGEEGYPAYLGSRIAEFYARAGRVRCLGEPKREGALSVIGAVSPPGGDLSEPVTQNTLRVVKVFWSLDDKLANRRHFPAIHWLTSYSLYADSLEHYYAERVGRDWPTLRREALKLLQLEAELEEIVRLVGVEALSPQDRLVLETARSIREDFLMQNAFDEVDTFTSLEKQLRMLRLIMSFYERGREALERGAAIEPLVQLPVREEIARAKLIPEGEWERFEAIEAQIERQIAELVRQEEQEVRS